MKRYIFIGIGGFLGAILRVYIKNINVFGYNGSFPFNTLLINITGSFLLALILFSIFGILKYTEDIKTGLTVGLLGAFTTFSTLCRETVDMFLNGTIYSGAFYIGISIIGGVTAAGLGSLVAGKLTNVSFLSNTVLESSEDTDDLELKEK